MKGCSLNPGTVSKHHMVAEYRSILFRSSWKMFHLNKSGFHHADRHSTRTNRDEADVKSLLDMLQTNWFNPLCIKKKDLVCLSPRKVVSHNIEFDLINAKEVGEQECRAFNQQRLQSTLPVWSYGSFMIRWLKRSWRHSVTLTKRWKSAKEPPRKLTAKNNLVLFAQMIVTAKNRNLNKREGWTNPLRNHPWALATSKGHWVKPTSLYS